MTQAQSGHTVRVHYTGKLQDGRVFDTSRERDPLEFTIGEGTVIPGFEHAVIGMAPGETKCETIAPEEGFGPRRDDMVQAVERNIIPEHVELTVGKHLQVTDDSGQATVFTIVDLTEESVTLDANHPLAGESLEFDIELIEILA